MTRVWSLFSGAMGLDLGLEAAGLPAELAVEIEPKYCETIRRNRPDIAVLQADVATLVANDLFAASGGPGEIDLMVGGPPCQSFSSGGKRAALSDPRGNLIFEYLRLIGEVRPKYFILENVSNLVTAALLHRPIADRPGKKWNLSSYATNDQLRQLSLSELGDRSPPLTPDEQSGSALRFVMDTAVAALEYHVSFGIVNAADFGAPQKRLRFVMIGSRDGLAPELPHPTHGPGTGQPYLTLRDTISDLALDPGPGSAYTPSVREIFDQVPPGGNWRSLPEPIGRAAMGERSWAAGGGKTGFFRRLSWDQPSPTITGKANRKGSAMCHPEFSRPLSVSECARLQGFPDSWIFSGAANAQYTQIGNAVPAALGLAAGIAVAEALRGEHRPDLRDITELWGAAVEKVRAAARNKRVAA